MPGCVQRGYDNGGKRVNEKNVEFRSAFRRKTLWIWERKGKGWRCPDIILYPNIIIVYIELLLL